MSYRVAHEIGLDIWVHPKVFSARTYANANLDARMILLGDRFVDHDRELV